MAASQPWSGQLLRPPSQVPGMPLTSARLPVCPGRGASTRAAQQRGSPRRPPFPRCTGRPRGGSARTPGWQLSHARVHETRGSYSGSKSLLREGSDRRRRPAPEKALLCCVPLVGLGPGPFSCWAQSVQGRLVTSALSVGLHPGRGTCPCSAATLAGAPRIVPCRADGEHFYHCRACRWAGCLWTVGSVPSIPGAARRVQGPQRDFLRPLQTRERSGPVPCTPVPPAAWHQLHPPEPAHKTPLPTAPLALGLHRGTPQTLGFTRRAGCLVAPVDSAPLWNWEELDFRPSSQTGSEIRWSEPPKESPAGRVQCDAGLTSRPGRTRLRQDTLVGPAGAPQLCALLPRPGPEWPPGLLPFPLQVRLEFPDAFWCDRAPLEA